MLKWDLATDSLQVGQWIKPKVRHFDLNSDGSLILCSIQSYRKKDDYSPYVTLSKPPWYTALALWKVGDSWGGICGFSDDNTILIQGGMEPLKFKGTLNKGLVWNNNKGEMIYSRLTERRGWKLDSSQEKWVKYHPKSGFGLIAQRIVNGKTVLAWPTAYHSWFWKDPITGTESTSSSIDISLASCADIDPKGRLVYSMEDGKMYSIEKYSNGKYRPRILHDLNDLNPKWVTPPTEATKW